MGTDPGLGTVSRPRNGGVQNRRSSLSSVTNVVLERSIGASGHPPRLHTEWLRVGRRHAGIIVLPDQRAPVGAQINALTALVNARSPETMQDQLGS